MDLLLIAFYLDASLKSWYFSYLKLYGSAHQVLKVVIGEVVYEI